MSGRVEASAGGGQFLLADVVLDAPGPVSIDGKLVSAGHGFLTEKALGAIDAAGSYRVPAGTARVLLTARIDGNQVAMRATNSGELSGTFDLATGVFTLVGDLEEVNGRATASASLSLAFENRPPIARIAAPGRTSCTEPGRAQVRLSALDSTDPDGITDIAHYLWLVDRGSPTEVSLSGIQVELPLPLGSHEIQLFVQDSHGSISSAAQEIAVVDDEGPVLETAALSPSCLWPPNHRLAHYVIGQNIHFTARDRCTPGGETVRVVGVTSTEPADRLGDGTTPLDAVLTKDGFCVRSERSGRSPEGRQYLVSLEAVDSLGNASAHQLMVTSGVAHDQSGLQCQADGIDFVEDDDPACAAAPGSTASPTPTNLSSRRTAAGCASVPAQSFLSLLLVSALLRRRLRS